MNALEWETPKDDDAVAAEPLDYQPNAIEPDGRFCPRCGGRAIRGNLLSRAGIRFVPDHLRRIWDVDAGAVVTAYACPRCETVTLAIEPHEQPQLVRLATPGTLSRRCGRVIGHVWRWLGGRRESPGKCGKF